MRRLLQLLNIPLNLLSREYVCGDTPFPGITKETLQKLELQFDRLRGSNSKSLIKKHLTPRMVHDLKQIKTDTYSANLLDCIQSGLEYLDSPIGVYAPDAESYETFKKLFDPVIRDLHCFDASCRQPEMDFGDYLCVKDLDPQNRHIVSTRMRVLRNIEGYPLAPLMTKEHYEKMEGEIIPVLSRLQGELKGLFFDEESLLNAKRLKWINEHMYGIPDRFMAAAKIGRHHPIGRGLYHTADKKFSVWMNFEDHLRIVSMQDGGDAGQVYRRLIDGLDQLDKYLPFMRDERLGFVTTNPKNLGTALRASVHIKLLKLPTNETLFSEILDRYDLQVRGTYGAGHPIEKGVYDISNRRTLGITEFKAVQQLCQGVTEIMRWETMMRPPCDCKFIKWG